MFLGFLGTTGLALPAQAWTSLFEAMFCMNLSTFPLTPSLSFFCADGAHNLNFRSLPTGAYCCWVTKVVPWLSCFPQQWLWSLFYAPDMISYLSAADLHQQIVPQMNVLVSLPHKPPLLKKNDNRSPAPCWFLLVEIEGMISTSVAPFQLQARELRVSSATKICWYWDHVYTLRAKNTELHFIWMVNRRQRRKPPTLLGATGDSCASLWMLKQQRTSLFYQNKVKGAHGELRKNSK